MRSDITMDIHRQRGPVRSDEIAVADNLGVRICIRIGDWICLISLS